jgi:hypothetical protein
VLSSSECDAVLVRGVARFAGSARVHNAPSSNVVREPPTRTLRARSMKARVAPFAAPGEQVFE